MKFLKKEKLRYPHQASLGMEYWIVLDDRIIGTVEFIRTPPYNTGSWWASVGGRTSFGRSHRQAAEAVVKAFA